MRHADFLAQILGPDRAIVQFIEAPRGTFAIALREAGRTRAAFAKVLRFASGEVLVVTEEAHSGDRFPIYDHRYEPLIALLDDEVDVYQHAVEQRAAAHWRETVAEMADRERRFQQLSPGAEIQIAGSERGGFLLADDGSLIVEGAQHPMRPGWHRHVNWSLIRQRDLSGPSNLEQILGL